MGAWTSFPRVVRNKFVTGLIILIPIVITVKALAVLFTYLDHLARPLTVRWFGEEVPGIGFITTVAAILLMGVLFSGGPLRRLLDGLADVVESVPLVGTIYGTLKKVLEGFGSPRARQAFRRFVLARLPGRTTPGFLTGTFTLRQRDGSEKKLCTVYIPTNHLYVGDVVVVPAEDVIETDLTVEDGMSVILSAGAAIPGTVMAEGSAGDPARPGAAMRPAATRETDRGRPGRPT
jgi:uncharacterized membrane protein